MQPSDPRFPLADLVDRIKDLQTQIDTMNATRRPIIELATVTATGGAQCTVTYDSGEVKVLPYLKSYTPVVGHRVRITNSPAWFGVDDQISA